MCYRWYKSVPARGPRSLEKSGKTVILMRSQTALAGSLLDPSFHLRCLVLCFLTAFRARYSETHLPSPAPSLASKLLQRQDLCFHGYFSLFFQDVRLLPRQHLGEYMIIACVLPSAPCSRQSLPSHTEGL